MSRADGGPVDSAGADRWSRRRFLGGSVGVVAGGRALAGPVAARSEARDPAVAAQSGVPDAVGTELVADGFTAPVGVAIPPGERERGYVVDQAGRVTAVGLDGAEPEPFLDVTDRMVDLGGGYDERGLLGLAFHPAFEENGRLFVRYSAPRRSDAPADSSHTFVLSEFAANGDPPVADPDSERAVLEIPQPQSNHNAGDLAFGPDGLLYVGVGDGGAANDQGAGHVDDWYDAVPGGNGQDVTENLLGSILRIDVDAGAEGDGNPYVVPDDNPLVGRDGPDEQYAWGFRNPWRLSFDGDRLFVADVGQDEYEEVNLVEAGGNYGWNVREGAHCFDAADCPTHAPDEPPYDGQPLRDPIVEYAHGGDGPTGVAVVGGYVSRGEGVPSLDGRYVFADWRSDGRLFVAAPPDGDGRWELDSVRMTQVAGPAPGSMVLGFGRDRDGGMYVCTTDRGGVSGDTGAVHRLVEPDDDGSAEDDSGTDGTTETNGQPGFGALVGLLGLGAASFLAARSDR